MLDKANNKKTITVVGIVFGLICALAIYWFAYYAPLQKYNLAMNMIDREEYAEAASVLEKINSFKDSREIRNRLINKNESIAFYKARQGDLVSLGYYEQDGNLENGKEQLEWIVLSNQDNRVIAVSRYVLDVKPYNAANGEGSSLKLWLKDNFSKEAFSREDDYIKKVTLLTKEQRDEYESILPSKTKWTAYAELNYNGEKVQENVYDKQWWLNGKYYYESRKVDIVMDTVREIHEFDFSKTNQLNVTEMAGVRPVLVIEYNHDTSNYYVDDEKDFQNAGKVTRTKEDVYIPKKNKDSSSSSGYTTNRTGSCSGGAVSCRTGFHPCHEMSNGYCNQCCKNA